MAAAAPSPHRPLLHRHEPQARGGRTGLRLGLPRRVASGRPPPSSPRGSPRSPSTWLLTALAAGTVIAGCKHAQSSKPDGLRGPASPPTEAASVPAQATRTEASAPAALPPSLDTLDLDESELAIVRQIVSEQFDPCGKPRSFLQSLQAGDCALADRLGRFVVLGVQKGYGKRRMVGMLLREIERLNTVVDIQPGAAPRLGPEHAPVVIIAFSDFECPFCRRAAQPLKKLQAHYGAALYFKYFPLRNHSFAEPASRAAWAAQRQGRFWEMHDMLFAHNEALDWPSVKGYAKKLGLDLVRFAADVESDAAREAVAADYKEGTEAGVDGTPTFFINGHRAESVQQVEDAIREQLKLKKAPSIPARLDLQAGAEGAAAAPVGTPAKGRP